MKMDVRINLITILVLAFICIGISGPATGVLYAHIETLDSLIVQDARFALNKNDLNPVLKWVNKEQETELKAAFEKAIAQRTKGDKAREDADMEFFNTLARLYHADEGTPFAGLKPAGSDTDPTLMAVRLAMVYDSVDPVLDIIANNVASGLRTRFTNLLEKGKHANESVEAGREFVKVYIEFVHYAQRLHADAVAKMTPPPEAEITIKK